VLVAAIVALASVVQLATGFGFALVCMPALALVIDPHLAVLITLEVGMVGAFYQAVEGRQHVDRQMVARLLAAAAVGLPAGWWVYSLSSAAVLKFLIGLLVLSTVVLLARGFRLSRASTQVDLTAGVLTGFLTTCTGISGPPIVTVLHARQVAPEAFRAMTSTVFSVLDGLAVLVFVATGDIGWPLTLLVLSTLPGLAAGAWIGIRARLLMSPQTFRVVVLSLLAATGLTAVVTALL